MVNGLEIVALKNPATIASSSPKLVRTVVEPLSTVMKSNDTVRCCCCPSDGDATNNNDHANPNTDIHASVRRIASSFRSNRPALLKTGPPR